MLVNFSLCDTLLRLAEPPQLFEPKWSEQIIQETTRTLEKSLDWPRSLVLRFESELRTNFSEAWIEDYQSLISQMENDEKDRHVLAAAVFSRSPTIVTFNLRHFRTQHLDPWGIRALHPQAFLTNLWREEEALVLAKMNEQAFDRSRSLHHLLEILSRTVPEFVALVAARI